MKSKALITHLLLIVFAAYAALHMFTGFTVHHSSGDHRILSTFEDDKVQYTADEQDKKVPLPAIVPPVSEISFVIVLILFIYSLSSVKLIRRFLFLDPVHYSSKYVDNFLNFKG
ncbi:hypothetical protein ACFVHQ_02785 [Actinomycetes bacterium NPDC127524]